MRQFGQLRGTSQKVSDWLQIPLQPRLHTGQFEIERIGVESWEQLFGTQVSHLERLSRILGYDLFELAGIKR